MTTDIHAAFEAKYKASAQDPACAEELRHFTDGWNAARAAIPGSSQAAFEATVSQVGEFYFEKDAAGEYINSYARTAWIVWQARDAEIAALREDAERLNWLAENMESIFSGHAEFPRLKVPAKKGAAPPRDARGCLNAAIDRARKDGAR